MTCIDETTRRIEVSAAELRHAMGHFATGVTVITSIGADLAAEASGIGDGLRRGGACGVPAAARLGRQA